MTINWTDIVVAIVALYGAALSTYTFIVNIRDKRRVVKVKISNGFITHGPDLSPPMLLIKLSNPGDRTVTLQSPYILLPSGESLIFITPQSDVRFPHGLVEGKSCTVWIEIHALVQQLLAHRLSGSIKIIAACDDAVGSTYKSKPWDLDIDMWSRDRPP